MKAQPAAPGKGTVWRPLTKRERTFECAAVGLPLGDCSQTHVEGSTYCYYHNKVMQGLIDYFEANTEHGLAEVSPRHYYPVWPLPKSGYVLLCDTEVAA